MNELKTTLTHIVAEKPELLKNLNISIPQLWHFVDHLIENGVAVPVRCKDCVKGHQELSFNDNVWCVKWEIDIQEDGFCSCGERKMFDI